FGGTVSATVYVVKLMMPVKSLVLAVVPSSTSEKVVNGRGDAVKSNCCDELTSASLMMVICAGKVTASAVSDRSCAPVWQFSGGRQSKASWLMCQGDPEIDTAEFPIPQSARVAMCPPQASTAAPLVAGVKFSAIAVCVSPFCFVEIVYADTLLMVPLYIVKNPRTWLIVLGARGIWKTVGAAQTAADRMSEQGSAVSSVRLKVVK